MESSSSRAVKAGKRTYFFDIKKSKQGERYLAITESRLKGQGQGRERSTILVFPETVNEFVETLNELTQAL